NGVKEPETGEETQKWDFWARIWGVFFWTQNWGISRQDSDSDSEGGEGRLCSPSDPVLAQVGPAAPRSHLVCISFASHLHLVCISFASHWQLQRDLQRLRDEIQELTREIRGGLRGLEPAKEDEENPNSIGARLRRTQVGFGGIWGFFWGPWG
ncbi:STX4 protein, partial [Oriolus oriolus]|nr:STX4 protein [Oriolus oriolus]